MIKIKAGGLGPHTGKRGLAVAALFALVFAAGCGSGGGTTPYCPNLPIASAVLGQSSLNSGAANAGGISATTLSGPLGALASNGTLSYVADTGNNRILGYLTPPAATGAAANFELGQGDATGTDFSGGAAGTSNSTLSSPSKVTISADNRLVVADTGNNRVLIWNTLPTGNVPADVVVGQPNFTSFRANQMLAAPTASTLSSPTSAIIVNGYLIVVDQGNNRVLIWNSVPSAVSTPADVELGQSAIKVDGDTTTNCTTNSGTTGFCFTTSAAAGDDAATTGTRLGLSSPTDVWSDGFKLLVSDTGNNRVLYWSQVPFASNTLYNFVIGQTAPAQNAAAGGSQGLRTPWGVYSDGASVYVGDSGNNRVLQYSGFPFQHGPAAVGVFGQADFTHVTANDADQNGTAGAIAASTLSFPTGVYVSPSGQLQVTDRANNRIALFGAASVVDGSATSLCNGINPRVQ